jgi:hypothetical protein
MKPVSPVVPVLGGCLTIMFGAKLWLISQYGTTVPFWDQWNAEGGILYKPYFDGTLRLSALLAPHNEHRIFFSRILALALLVLDRRWDPPLQMIVNAALHVAAIGALLAMLARGLRLQSVAALALFTAAFLVVPFAWENTIGAFQSPFYFYLLFVILAVWAHGSAWSLSWITATLLAVASFFSLSSGALTPFVLAAISVFQISRGAEAGPFESGAEWQCKSD